MTGRRKEWQGNRFYPWRDRDLVSVTTALEAAWPAVQWRIPYGAKHVAERAVFQFAELARRLDSEDPVDWTLKWLKAAPTERRDAAGDHGTDLHTYLEGRLLGTLGPAPERDTYSGYQAIEDFLNAYRPDPLFVEATCYSTTYGYAGTADAFLDIYGRRFVFDLKSGNDATNDHKVRLQLAAYRYADFVGEDDREVGPVPMCDAGLVLSIPRDKPRNWQPIEVEAGIHEHDRFLDALSLWRFYETNKGTGIGELLLPQTEAA